MTEFDERVGSVLADSIDGFEELTKVERLSGGASQETYRIVTQTNGRERLFAMRRAPGGEHVEPTPGHPGLATEALLMQCARQADVPEPEVFHVLSPADGLGDGFVMEWLDGIALGAKVVRDPQLDSIRPKLAYHCGEILAKIHAIDLVSTGLNEKLDVLSPAAYVEQTWQRYRDFDTAQPMIDYAGRWLLDHLPKDHQAALVHNDFRNGNVMFSPDGVVAVLDWEVAHIGDPMRDLGWICTNSWRFGRTDLPVGGFGHYEDLFAGYESVSGEAVDPERVKFWEVFGSFWWAIGCLGMAEHFRTGPDKTVERPAIGRRSSECQVDCVNLLIPGPVELAGSGSTPEPDLAMPRVDELLVSVRDYLRSDVREVTEGRVNFLALVASNSLDIVLRENAVGTEMTKMELALLQKLFGVEDSLVELKQRLVDGLRNGTIELDMAGLAEYLRYSVVNQIAIDQPKYSGFKTATAGSQS